jgi:hypothetical protein
MFEGLEYLKSGTTRQRLAFALLSENEIFTKLEGFDPILTGTVPINIDIEGSDLDIICYWKNKEDFLRVLHDNFSGYKGFVIADKVIKGLQTVVCNFSIADFALEIFGQNRPTREQEAFRHMMVEYQILTQRGENFREDILKLKRSGIKTEPAFAHLLGLSGDPYEALLQYEIEIEKQNKEGLQQKY